MRRRAESDEANSERATDISILVEGCYPYVPGGVSAWIDWLIRSHPDLSFSVVALWPRPTRQQPRYALPPNVTALHHLYLQDFGGVARQRPLPVRDLNEVASALDDLMMVGGRDRLEELMRRLDVIKGRFALGDVFNSPAAWEIARRMYDTEMPYGSFLHFFWAWRALAGGLLATCDFKLPRAKVYHCISTGYAGVLASRAAIQTGRPAILTEHGIYTNERRIELLMADWVADTVDKGHALDDPRFDLRDMWVKAFEAYARTCYEACREIITLYEDNQRAQRALDAPKERLTVIANGIDLKRFEGVRPPPADARPTMALIGRVVSIKDVKTFIAAAHVLRRRLPNLRAVIAGPLDEERAYADECRTIATELGLDGTVEFAGSVNVAEFLSEVHVAVLTSLSESQPLVILEAGAAGIPFVATNVGSCREIIEGRSDENPPLGIGGYITGLVAPGEIADAVYKLLSDPSLRRRLGEALRARVERYYASERAVEAYRILYRRHMEAATTEKRPEEVA